ncbi:MAG: ferritin-like domain-containing protein, partial [Brevibacterium sp.]|nr:ferritin-like domain-containing protein [Brevibacterium sp.]
YRTAVDELSEPGYSLAITILDDTRATDYVRNRLTADVAADTQLASRLALWGRKLVAETLGRGRNLLTDPFLGIDEERVVASIPAVTANHSKRMSALGLVA